MADSVVVVGSGLAGYMFVKELRKHDAETELVIITSSSGDFYSKPQLSTALTKGQSASSLVVQSAEAMAKQLNATVMSNTVVTSIDKEQRHVCAGEAVVPYGKLVLAVGAEPIELSVPGVASGAVIAVNQLEDYARFSQWLKGKKHLGIVGTGLVGCEFMNDLLNTHHRVSMVSLESHPLARLLPAELGAAFEAVFAAAGVSWNLKDPLTGMQVRSTGASLLTLASGKEVDCDGVLSAVGLRPAVKLAQAAGLHVDKGIVVDRFLATSDPHIYALGDCAQVNGLVWQYVAPLLQSARALAKTVSGQALKVVYPPMPVVIKTPHCPVVALPPLHGVEGEWTVDGSDSNFTATYHDGAGQLQGFALMGDNVRQRQQWIKQIRPVFECVETE